MTIETTQEFARHPVQLDRVKREAKRLSRWTGAQLSSCQELTARALGATSWQALLQSGTFVPDEELPTRARPASISLEARYSALTQLLATRLHLNEHLASMLACLWQPSALRANMGRVARQELTRGDAPVVSLQYALGGHPALPEGAVLAFTRVAAVGKEPVKVLVAVRPGRQAVTMDLKDCVPVDLTQESHQALQAVFASKPKLLVARVQKILARPSAFSLSDAQIATLRAPLPPAQVQASWLREPVDLAVLNKTFAEQFPWKAEDYPGLRKSAKDAFWSDVFGSTILRGSIASGSLCFVAYDATSPSYEHSHVQAGVGGLRYMAKDSGQMSDRPGFYLVKYNNQLRSGSPLPGVTEDIARDICEKTGLSPGPEMLALGYPSHPLSFYATEAGFAFAKWLAASPRRASRFSSDYEPYMGMPSTGAEARMFFEVARVLTLD